MNSKQIDDIIKNTIEYIQDTESWSDEERFGKIALDLYNLHREHNEVYERYSIGELSDWRQIPLMPISEFKKHNVGINLSDKIPFPGVEFHSSGTTQGDKSKHRMYDTETYRASIAAGFKQSVHPTSYPRFRVILLTPKLPNSSLYYMMSYVSELFDYRGIRDEFDGLTDSYRVNELLNSLKDEKEPVLFFGTSLAFYDLMGTIKTLKDASPMKLPEGSMMIETGGWKGRDIKITPWDLTTKVSLFFDISFDNCIREYSMSEISSQLWAAGNDPGDVSYYWPQWLSVRLVDPLSQTEMPHGQSGIISFVDLANVWSCPFILTEDMGHLYTDGNGFSSLVLEGRAVNAPEKGCSLTYAQAMGN